MKKIIVLSILFFTFSINTFDLRFGTNTNRYGTRSYFGAGFGYPYYAPAYRYSPAVFTRSPYYSYEIYGPNQRYNTYYVYDDYDDYIIY